MAEPAAVFVCDLATFGANMAAPFFAAKKGNGDGYRAERQVPLAGIQDAVNSKPTIDPKLWWPATRIHFLSSSDHRRCSIPFKISTRINSMA